jgi:DNA-binding response OmpR family regulator
LRALKILSLDDDENFNKLLVKKLESHNFILETTDNTNDFFNLYTKEKWDFCLIDLNLNEGVDAGFKVIQFLHKKFESVIPLLVLSRSSEKEKIAHALECGADDFISKPLDVDMLTSKIRYLFDEGQFSEYTSTLKMALVPSKFQESSLTINFQPLKITVGGLTVLSDHLVSKGTSVHIKGALVNKIFDEEQIKLMVSKNSKNQDQKYEVFLEFNETNQDLAEKAKSWIRRKVSP